ncbi:hypothetical protein BVRB_5g106900 [Beta vulgaris subsp. vulgaris]|nr:hypothetical protein BVRB_5g106900 [Beta vulgaris subsp. vulgaris]
MLSCAGGHWNTMTRVRFGPTAEATTPLINKAQARYEAQPSQKAFVPRVVQCILIQSCNSSTTPGLAHTKPCHS